MTPAASPPVVNIRRLLAACALSLLSGSALIVAMPRFGGCWPLAFVALVPMIFAQYRLLPYRLCGLAPALTIGSWWMVGLYQLNSIAGPPLIVLIGMFAALSFGLLFSSGRRFNERSGYSLFLLDLPALWIASELLRGHSSYLGSSGWLAYDLAPVPALIQPVSLFGTPALGFLILAVNAALALSLIARYDQRHHTADSVPVPAQVARRTLTLTLAAAAGWAALSAGLYARPLEPTTVRVAIVQPGDKDLARLAGMTRASARQGAQIIVWPEDILDFDPTQPAQPLVSNLARETRRYILTGYTLDSGKSSNKSALFSPEGIPVGSFHKNHPVLLMGENWNLPKTYPVWPTALGNIGPLICFDLSFPTDSARETASGAQLLLIPSFGPASTASDQYHIAQFRAAENQVALVKADWAWASAIIDPRGQVLSHSESLSPVGEERLLIADVPLGNGQGTFFSHHEQWLSAIFYGMALLRIALQRRRYTP